MLYAYSNQRDERYFGEKKMNWVKERIGERTTWDGGVMIAMGLIALFATSFIKLAAIAAIAYGAWTIWKAE